MPSKSKFQALVEKRKRFIESVKENNFEVDLLLAGLYSDPSQDMDESVSWERSTPIMPMWRSEQNAFQIEVPGSC